MQTNPQQNGAPVPGQQQLTAQQIQIMQQQRHQQMMQQQAAQQQQQQMMRQRQMQQQQQPRPQARASRPTEKALPKGLDMSIPESKLFTRLVELEQTLDATIQRRRLSLLDTLQRANTHSRQMRIFISNQASDQYVEEGVLLDAAADNVKCPSWTLKIEGRMLDSGAPAVRGATPRKFSHFCKSVLVELQDSTSSSDSTTPLRKNVIEWHNQPGSPEVDGFEIKRKGDADTPVKIYIYLANSPEKFKLAPKLAALLDIHTDTKANVINAVWQYVKTNKLQDAADRRFIFCDAGLQAIFSLPRINFPQIPDLLTPHLLAADPIILTYTVRVDKEYNLGQYAYDVDVDVPDLSHQAAIGEIPGLTREISVLEERIGGMLTGIAGVKMRRDFFAAFAKDPAGFIKKWLASQNKDLSVVIGDVQLDGEEARLGSFYDQPWVHDAVFRLLNEQRGV